MTRDARATKQSRREPRRQKKRGCEGLRDGGEDTYLQIIEDTARALLRTVRALKAERGASSHARFVKTLTADKHAALVRPPVAESLPSKSKRRRTRRQRARAARELTAVSAARAAAVEVDSARAAGASASLYHPTSRGNTVRPHANAAPMDFTNDCRPAAVVAAAPAAVAAAAETFREAMLTDSGDQVDTVVVAQPMQPIVPLGSTLNPSASSFEARVFTFGGPLRFDGGISPKPVETTIAEIFQQYKARPAHS